jgi:hypothetical protein
MAVLTALCFDYWLSESLAAIQYRNRRLALISVLSIVGMIAFDRHDLQLLWQECQAPDQ